MVVNSKVMLRTTAEVNKVVNGEPTVVDVSIFNPKYVARGEDKREYITLDDVIETKRPYDFKLPRLRTDLRKDVYEFFNAQLTNTVNRRLKNSITEKFMVNGVLKQVAASIDDYTDDIEELIEAAKTDETFAKVLKEIFFMPLHTLGDEFKEILESYLAIEAEETLPLIFILPVQTVMLDKINLPKNSRLEDGETLLVLKPEEVLPKTGITGDAVTSECLIFTNKGTYVLDNTNSGGLTIRKSNLDEFWEQNIIS